MNGEKVVWCDFTDEAKAVGYKAGGNGEQGRVVGESRDGEKWRVKWDGISSVYSYYKEYIKLLNKK